MNSKVDFVILNHMKPNQGILENASMRKILLVLPIVVIGTYCDFDILLQVAVQLQVKGPWGITTS